MRGTKVDLPQGFAGVVLSAPDGARGAPVTSAPAAKTTQSRTRPKRGLSKKQAMEVEDAEDGDEDMDGAADIPTIPARTLQATGTFSSFVLWNPDIPVDEGRDEYLRSLTEWTKIAAEVRGWMAATRRPELTVNYILIDSSLRGLIIAVPITTGLPALLAVERLHPYRLCPCPTFLCRRIYTLLLVGTSSPNLTHRFDAVRRSQPAPVKRTIFS